MPDINPQTDETRPGEGVREAHARVGKTHRKPLSVRELRSYLPLVLIMVMVVAASVGVGFGLLYGASFEEQKNRLTEIAKSQARLIEAVARFDRRNAGPQYPDGSAAATLSQVMDAHRNYQGTSTSGEFVLAKREGDQIHFIFRQRNFGIDVPEHVPFDSELATPMQHALLGQSGTIIGVDYEGRKVLAAYEPVAVLDLGIVAKIDLWEIRAPFIEAGAWTLGFSLLIIIAGIAAFRRTFKPIAASIAKSNALISAFVDNASDAIVTINSKGIVQTVNPATERMFGYLAEEMIGQNVGILMPDRFSDRHDEYLGNYQGTSQGKVIGVGRELTGLGKSGRTFPIDLTVSEICLGDERLFAGIVRDITERRKVEDDLRVAKNRAEKANRTKSEFLANMSHELRTPLNAIIGYGEMLQEEAEEDGSAESGEDLSKIITAGHHLLGLINDILDLSKIEAGKMTLHNEEFSVPELVAQTASALDHLVKRNNNTLIVQSAKGLGTAYGDETKFKQVLMNLLSNAAKFTKAGVIVLDARMETILDKDWITFRVTDTGVGMTEETQAKVFNAFVQADASTTREYGGTGLGLTITRKLCDVLGGVIELKSEPGSGTTFTVRLPATAGGGRAETPKTRVANETGEDERTGTGGAEKFSEDDNVILVIDDDADGRDLLSRLLTRAGYSVVTAASGREGLELAKTIQPVAITLDVLMPDLTGWSVLSEIKGDPSTAHIPVLVCSIVDEKGKGYALGASDYMTKPIDRVQLEKILSKYCSPGEKKRVLVVEDDAPSRDMLAATLAKSGWEVDEAENGKIAIRSLEKNIPDLMILDLMMPVMDGFGVIEEVRRNEAWRHIPILVVTARDLSVDDINRLNGNVTRIIEKSPQITGDLLQAIESAIGVASTP